MNLAENVCLDEFQVDFKTGSSGVKMFVLMISRSSLKLDHVGSKPRSPGHISVKPKHSGVHI